MRFSKRTVRAAIVTTLVVGLVVTVCVGVGVAKLWPVARTWAQKAIGAGDIGGSALAPRESVRGVLWRAQRHGDPCGAPAPDSGHHFRVGTAGRA
jgi:hypothetical protein